MFATGYKADLASVPYLRALPIETRNGFPRLDPACRRRIPGLYLPGFAATQDFGPFFGFVKGAPAAAELIARDLLTPRRASAAHQGAVMLTLCQTPDR